MSSDNAVILVTGADRGLGLQTVKLLLGAPGYLVLLGTRSIEKGEDAIASLRRVIASSQSSVASIQIDVTSDESIKNAFNAVTKQYGRLDALVNNAGIHLDLDIQNGKYSTREGYNMMWNTNIVGAHVATEVFAPLLIEAPSPRLIFITSGTSSLSETDVHEGFIARYNACPEKGWPKARSSNPIVCYRSCKAGLNMLMTQWERILKNDGVKVFCVAPGFLDTGLMGVSEDLLHEWGAIDPAIGAALVRDVLAGCRDDDAGKVVKKDAVQAW